MVINTTKLYLFLLFPPPLQNLPFICFPVPLGIFHILPRTFTYLKYLSNRDYFTITKDRIKPSL